MYVKSLDLKLKKLNILLHNFWFAKVNLEMQSLDNLLGVSVGSGCILAQFC
jgi:hypothetical protein